MYKIVYTCPRCGVITDMAESEDLDEIEIKLDTIQAASGFLGASCTQCRREIEQINFSLLVADTTDEILNDIIEAS